MPSQYNNSSQRKFVATLGLGLMLSLGTAINVAQAASDATAVFGSSSDPGHFNPAITTGYNVHIVADSMFNGLVALSADLQPVPDLATSWSANETNTAYTFKLKPGVLWHDGEKFSARDVKFTFDNVLFKYHSRTKAGLGNVVKEIEVVDDLTVVFHLTKPYGPLLQRLDVTEAAILPMHIFATGEPNDHPANLQPVGTGPFKFKSYNKGESVVLVRNENYFKEGLPKLDKLVFRIIPDKATRLLALENGEVDYLNRVPASEVERLKKSDQLAVISTSTGAGGGNCIVTQTFNLDRPALADIRVRQAIAHGIDRNEILQRVIYNQGRVADAPISSGIPWAHAEGILDQYDYSPEKATALLEDAGFKPDADGVRLKLDVVHFPAFSKYAEVMRQQLAKVGINLDSRPLDRAAAIETIFKNRTFDTNIISYCNGLDPDIGVRRMYVSNNIGNIPFSNGAAYRDEAVDKLFASAGETVDPAVRKKLYTDVQAKLADDLPYWWLVERHFISAHDKAFTGFSPWTGQFAERAEKLN